VSPENSNSFMAPISPSFVRHDLSSATPVQKIITAEKGIALDFQSLSRDTQGQSKELYHWGQDEHSDVKDGRYSNDGTFFFDSLFCRSLR
jgi:hypothetical protein